VGGEEGLEGQEVIAFDDEVAFQGGLFALGQEGQLGVELQAVMGHGVVVGLDDRLAFELQRGHCGLPLSSLGRRGQNALLTEQWHTTLYENPNRMRPGPQGGIRGCEFLRVGWRAAPVKKRGRSA